MTDDLRIALRDLLRKAPVEEDADFLREGMRVFAQAVMELAVTQHVGAERHARTAREPGSATAIGNGRGTRGWARLSCRCHGCATAATSPRSSIPAAVPSVR